MQRPSFHQRPALALAALAVLVLGLAPACSSANDPAPLAGSLAGRDVILIVADALHAHHLGAHGYQRPTSPTIDHLALTGTLFADASSQTSWTVSSVASLFTSLEQERHGLLYANQHLAPDASTLAELFQDGGYRTAAMIQNGILWSRRDQPDWPGTRLCRGFDSYEMFPDMDRVQQELDRLLTRAREVVLEEERPPLFAYIHLLPPHEPYTPPAGFRDRFDPDYAGPVDGSLDSSLRVALSHEGFDQPEDLAHLVALYDEHLAYLDAELGRFLTELWAARPDSLVIFTSDHGEAFREHRNLGHGSQVHEEMVHVPLILSAPQSPLPQGRVCGSPPSLLDVLPTLVELCGLPQTRQTPRGLSLVPLLAEPLTTPAAFEERGLLFTSRYKAAHPEQLNIALRQGNYKLLRHWKDQRDALYNVAADPLETDDISGQRPELARALGRALEDAYRASTRDVVGDDQAAPGTIPQDVLDNLHKMGYLGEDGGD